VRQKKLPHSPNLEGHWTEEEGVGSAEKSPPRRLAARAPGHRHVRPSSRDDAVRTAPPKIARSTWPSTPARPTVEVPPQSRNPTLPAAYKRRRGFFGSFGAARGKGMGQ